MDESHLDKKYFIDEYKYNCPFCNRRHVSYVIEDKTNFDWTQEKECFIYLAKCKSCEMKSMHLSFSNIPMEKVNFSDPREGLRFKGTTDEWDDLFFYSVPTSFFILDKRIPRILREQITEAEGSLKSNFLTGASACIRKAIYELAVLQRATAANYEERIKELKRIKSDVEPTFFDTLLTIQQVTSSKVHEQSYDGWESKHLRLILSTLTEILHAIYVVPALCEEKRKNILELKDKVLGGKEQKEPSTESKEDTH